MTTTELIALATVMATISSVIITNLISAWVNKRKIPAEVGELNAKASLTKGELAEKYLAIANIQADENLELSGKLKIKEQEKNDLTKELEQIRIEIQTMKSNNQQEIEEVKRDFAVKFAAVQLENEKLRDWANRLVLQLQSWRIQPTPYDIEEAKKRGLSLGDVGPCITEDDLKKRGL